MTGCSWVKYVKIPGTRMICCRKRGEQRHLKHEWGGPGTFSPVWSPGTVSQQDHAAHPDLRTRENCCVLPHWHHLSYLMVQLTSAIAFTGWNRENKIKAGKLQPGLTGLPQKNSEKTSTDQHLILEGRSMRPQLSGRHCSCRNMSCVTPPACRTTQWVLNILVSSQTPESCC